MKKSASMNGHCQIVQEVASILFEIADLFEDARVEELVKKCKKRLRLNSGNIYSQFIGTITSYIAWQQNHLGKSIVFFSFSVSFTIYLCTNQMGHLSARVYVWAAQVLEDDRLQPWILENGGWVRIIIMHCLLFACTSTSQCVLSHSIAMVSVCQVLCHALCFLSWRNFIPTSWKSLLRSMPAMLEEWS